MPAQNVKRGFVQLINEFTIGLFVLIFGGMITGFGIIISLVIRILRPHLIKREVKQSWIKRKMKKLTLMKKRLG